MGVFKKTIAFIKALPPYLKNVRRCRNLDFFEYEELSRVDFKVPEPFSSCLSYGHHRVVSNYKGRPFNLMSDYVEHGINANKDPYHTRMLGHLEHPLIKHIYTYGPFRREVIENCLRVDGIKGKTVHTMGPYILWADNQMTDERRRKVKEKYGRILTVYPIHSTRSHQAVFDTDTLISKINEIRGDFDTVFMCMYWRDIQTRRDLIEKYQSLGYVIVTNGHGSDPLFISRQKDMMMLSDMIMANGFGSHIGYAIALGKPVYMIKSEYKYKQSDASVSQPKDVIDIEERCLKLFGEYSHTITKEQLDFVYYYWGEFK
ncbi:MAG: hypothetical protein IJU90_02005 [Bacteroidales bacterium]|nr:hypothetical protein [Bacteroidales bacterium]